ncbi:MAG TPA: ABC transporter permease [Mycobacteriales bacterium]|nr:ABC transporter permease [Mycobacteriales bacterium]
MTTMPEPAGAGPRVPDTSAGFELFGPGTPVRALLTTTWRTRAVLFVLARKDFVARYRRTSLGLLWALALPLVQAVVLAAVFTRVVHVGSAVRHAQGGPGFSYAVFVYAGIVGWSYFSSTMPAASTAVVDNSGLAGKIYFPRLMLPLLAVATGIYPLLISLGLLLGMALLLQHSVGPEFLLVLPATVLTVAVTAGFGVALSALHVYFRDVRFVVQAVMSVLFYATPVIYSLANVPSSVRLLLALGPMAGPVELFRMATVGADSAWPQAVAGGCGWFVVLGAIGVWLHSRFDRVFVDRL